MSAAGAPGPEPAGRVIGWHRPGLTRGIWLILPLCILLTAAGALLVGYGYGRLERVDPVGLHRDARAAQRLEPSEARDRGEGEEVSAMWLLFGAGFLLVASGPALTILYLRRVWQRDDFLLLRTDALVASVDGAETSIPWDAIESVRFVAATKEIVLEMRDGGRRIVEPRLAGEGEPLARQLEDIRRKAIWNLLPQQRR